MKILISGILIQVLLFFTAACQQKTTPPSPILPVPTEKQLEWHEMEMNAFIHFTINTFTDLEWGMGNESPELFNPTQADPVSWVNILKETGFKGIILTCKHHDGFCLWPSAYTPHNISKSPYRNGQGNLVKELSAACRNEHMKFGIYLSPWDRNHEYYGRPEYIQYYRNQLKELFTLYGPVFEMWFDGANGGTGYYGGTNEKRNINGKTYYDWTATLEMIRGIDDHVIFFSDAGPDVRWVGNERGVAGETNWANITPDTLYPGKPGIEKILNEGEENGSHWIPSEVDVSIRPGWFYHQKEDSMVKSGQDLFSIYLTSVGRGSVLLLNVPPDRRGLIHENDRKALSDFRKILNVAFQNNLVTEANITASSIRGNAKDYQAQNVCDSNKETYWATDDEIKKGWIEFRFDEDKTIKYIVIQEYIKLGQRVKNFSIERLQDGKWVTVASGTTIGYKRIIILDAVTTSGIRVSITDAKACPVISSIGIY